MPLAARTAPGCDSRTRPGGSAVAKRDLLVGLRLLTGGTIKTCRRPIVDAPCPDLVRRRDPRYRPPVQTFVDAASAHLYAVLTVRTVRTYGADLRYRPPLTSPAVIAR